MNIFLGYLLTYLYLFGILGLTGLLKKLFNISDNSSRKIVHVMVSFAWIIMFYFFKYTIHNIIPPITFVIINYISYKKDTFKMMEIHDKEDKSLGTVYYAISILIMALISVLHNKYMLPYAIGLFCMSFGDGFAAIVGRFFEKYNIKLINKKTLFGSLTSFILSFIVIFIINCYFNINYSLIVMIIIALSSSLLELISPKGTDNLTVPIITSFIAYLFL